MILRPLGKAYDWIAAWKHSGEAALAADLITAALASVFSMSWSIVSHQEFGHERDWT